jgi:hypothetical protein
MKNRKKKPKQMRVLNLWTHSDASKAVPYLRSVTGSLREHYLDLLQTQRAIDRAESDQVSPRRDRIIAAEKQNDDRQRAQTKFDEALEELNRVDVFLLDPVNGTALIPFRKENDLAWFVFDHFAPKGLIGWRNHSDPIEECRPLEGLEDAAADKSLAK